MKLEGLRQPLEDRTVTLARAAGTLSFPATFTLAGAMSPCPCGEHGDPRRACPCAAGAVSRYQRESSGAQGRLTDESASMHSSFFTFSEPAPLPRRKLAGTGVVLPPQFLRPLPIRRWRPRRRWLGSGRSAPPLL